MSKFLSKLNSTNITLGPGQSFTGLWEKCSEFVSIEIYCFSDVSSISEGLILEGVNHLENTTTITQYDRLLYSSNNNFYKQYKIITNYFRIRYINSSSQQNIFSINTYMINSYTKLDSIIIPDGETLISGQPQLDAFNRLRTSQPFTILDIKHTPGLGYNDILVDYLNSDSGSYLLDQDASCINMEVGPGSGTVIAQSRRYITYQPGKSLLILLTGVLNANSNETNVISRIGYFDENNGYFFQWNNGVLSIIERSYISGSPIDTPVVQANWNVDKLNGTGKSGVNLDISKTQIFIFDLEWLGVGTVRAGVVVNGIIYYCHQFNHANSLSNVYMTTANLPLRYEIRSTGGSGTLRKICCSAISEGGYNPVGFLFSASNNAVSPSELQIDGSAAPKETAIFAIKINEGFSDRTTVVPSQFSILNAGSNALYLIIVRLYLSPGSSPVSFPLDQQADINSNALYGFGVDSTIYDTFSEESIIIYEEFASATNKGASTGINLQTINTINYLTKNIVGDSDYLVVSIKNLNNSAKDFYMNFQWTEVN